MKDGRWAALFASDNGRFAVWISAMSLIDDLENEQQRTAKQKEDAFAKIRHDAMQEIIDAASKLTESLGPFDKDE